MSNFVGLAIGSRAGAVVVAASVSDKALRVFGAGACWRLLLLAFCLRTPEADADATQGGHAHGGLDSQACADNI